MLVKQKCYNIFFTSCFNQMEAALVNPITLAAEFLKMCACTHDPNEPLNIRHAICFVVSCIEDCSCQYTTITNHCWVI